LLIFYFLFFKLFFFFDNSLDYIFAGLNALVYSMQSVQFFVLLFLGTITLVRRAQQRSYFNKLDIPSSLLGLLPHEEQGLGNLKDSVEEGNINRVVSILQNNIKQWSFVEAQLLEPNVNLGMPEIFIPLKHLTTTLEILGNIFFVRNELSEAKQCLERACPLMELLPSTLMDTMDSTGVGGGLNSPNMFQQKLEDASPQQNYAVECFSVLRKIYLKMYSSLDETDSKTMVSDGTASEERGLDSNGRFSDDTGELSLNEGDNFDVDSKIEELRQPFQHLRSELMMLQDENVRDDVLLPHTSSLSKSQNRDPKVNADFKQSGDMASSNSGKYRALFNSLHDFSKDSPASTRAVDLAGSVPRYGETATTLIAADMAIMLRNFVHADEGSRHAVFEIARKYYQDLDVNFPSLDFYEYAANMELGTVYLETMVRVENEGFDFIGRELDLWEQDGNKFIAQREKKLFSQEHDHLLTTGSHSFSTCDENNPLSTCNSTPFGVGIVWEMDPNDGSLKHEVAVDFDSSYYDSFPIQERNRLLVLSAFDIALHLEPDDPFDLSLGFNLGVLDSGRARFRDGFQYQSYHTAPSQDGMATTSENVGSGSLTGRHRHREHKRRSRPKTQPLENDVAAAIFEDQTLSPIGISSVMRSSVPTLKAEDDWTLHLFLAFMIATVLIVYVSYSESRKKQRNRQPRSNSRRNPDGFLGLFIRYLYPQYFDTDSSSGLNASPPEPPLDTMTFLSELFTLIVQLDFIQWVISLFVSSSDNAYSSTSASTSTISSHHTSGTSSQSSKSSSSSSKRSTGDRQTKNQAAAVPNNSSSGFLPSFIQRIVGSLRGNINTSVGTASTSTSSSSAQSSATVANTSASMKPSTSISHQPQKTPSKSVNHHNAIAIEKSVTPQYNSQQSLPATSPESSDSSTDDHSSMNAQRASTGGKSMPGNNGNKTSHNHGTIHSAAITNRQGKNNRASQNDEVSSVKPHRSSVLSGSDRDEGFYTAHGISASEDEGWQAAGQSSKRNKQSLHATQPFSGTGGRKSHDGSAAGKPVVGMPNYKAAISSAALANTSSTAVSAGANILTASKAHTNVAMASTAASTLMTNKLRGSPAISRIRGNSHDDNNQANGSSAVDATKAQPVAASCSGSYAQRLAGATTTITTTAAAAVTSSLSAPVPSTIFSVPPPTALTLSGPSYKHAVVTKKDKENSTSTLLEGGGYSTSLGIASSSSSSSLPSSAATTILAHSSVDQFASTQHASDLPSSNTLNYPMFTHSQYSSPGDLSVHNVNSSLEVVIDPFVTDSTGSIDPGLFGNIFGRQSTTPSYLLPTSSSHHVSSPARSSTSLDGSCGSSLLFPSMSTSQSFFRNDDLHLGFLNEPPLDAFATASSSPVKPNATHAPPPPPGLSIARATAAATSSSASASASVSVSMSSTATVSNVGSNGRGGSASARSASFDLLLGTSSNTHGSTSSSTSLFGALDVSKSTEEDGYVTSLLSNMLDDFLQPGSPAFTTSASTELTSLFAAAPAGSATVSSLLTEDSVSSSSSSYLLGGGVPGAYISAHMHQQMYPTLTSTPKSSNSSALVESDLSPDAPVFLPSSMFQMTPNHHPHHQLLNMVDPSSSSSSSTGAVVGSTSLFASFLAQQSSSQLSSEAWDEVDTELEEKSRESL
jgi:hypothetical protein